MAGVKGRSGGNNRKSVQEHKLNGTYRNNRHSGILQDKPMKVSAEHYINENYTVDKSKLFDSIFISQIVDLYAAYVETASIYAYEGVVAKVGNKLAITLMMELQKEMRVLLGEYSLTPSTRAVQSRNEDAVVDDPIADFLNAKPRLVK